MIKNKLMLVCLIILSGCQNKKIGRLATIDVAQPLKAESSLGFHEKFEVQKIISLKPAATSPLVEISKVFVHKDHIYVFDKKYSTLSAFDSTGNYLYSIGKMGEGEGEFMDLSDVAFDKRKEVFLLLSNGSHALYTFTPEGKFLKRAKIPFYASNLALLPEGDLAFYVNYNTSEVNAMHNVLITDPSGNIKQTYFPYANKSTPSFDITGYVAGNTAGALASPAFSDTIFQIGEAGISSKYVLDLDKYQYKEFENKDAIAIMQELGDHYFLKSGFLETDGWLAFTLVHRGRESKFFYQPTTNSTLCDAQFNPYSAIHYLKQPVASEEGVFISHLFTDYFLYMKKDRQMILDQVQKEDERLHNMLFTCKEGDSPVLVFYKIKNNQNLEK